MIVSLEDALQFLGITNPTPEQEAMVEMFIELVTAELEAYLDIKIIPTAITNEVIDQSFVADYSVIPTIDIRQYHSSIRLLYAPVSNVVLRDINNSVIAPSTYKIDENSGTIYLLGYCSLPIKANYTAGYNPIPKALQLVAMQGIKQYYSESGTTANNSGNVKGKQLDRFSVTYGNSNQMYSSGGGTGGKQYLTGNSAILNKYKNVQIWG